MESTQVVEQVEEAGAPFTVAEQEQAAYALRELARRVSDPEAQRVPQEQLEMVRPFFELGWVMGVRTGHTGPALADVPVDRVTVARAFVLLRVARMADPMVVAVARSLDPQHAGPVLWQKVDYHGSLTSRHGSYWVSAIHAHADPFGEAPELRYDLCEMRGVVPIPVVKNVRRVSITPLPEYRTMR
ncbi:hypothetical protein [Streptomyces griseomycini]|uniref:Uncharacterized protein n=2 Tax=Streptomyces TaxID=1883 RepID=A0A7W7PYB7_9ACTN|nr:hypothetical protein [Streptomyces griseomycini]MBB4903458.1 hypothetical protein [Streptomyces griseomycini]GGR56358.1 hypothetical protein GCM10015536_71770 [Streptomyces griseomycini]